MSSRVTLVTGGAGFIGSHLVEALVERGDRVRVVDNLSSGRREHLKAVADRIELVEADAGEAGDAETIIHLAALTSVPYSVAHPLETYAQNVAATVRLLASAARGATRRFILASSTAVTGDGPVPTPEGAPPAPASPYAVSKLACELYARSFGQSHGLEIIVLRLFNVYGPRQDPASPYSGVISRFADRLRRGESLSVFGTGQQTRDFIHVSDVVAALLRAVDAPAEACGAVYNIGSGTAVSILELAALMARLAGTTARITHRQARTGDILHSCADVRLARSALGFSARTKMEEGLRSLA